jgi:hypothetical protein
MKLANPEGSELSFSDEPVPMPSIPYHECRQIMTRADFLNREFNAVSPLNCATDLCSLRVGSPEHNLH